MNIWKKMNTNSIKNKIQNHVFGWMDDGWREVKAVLRIAYSNKKLGSTHLQNKVVCQFIRYASFPNQFEKAKVVGEQPAKKIPKTE